MKPMATNWLIGAFIGALVTAPLAARAADEKAPELPADLPPAVRAYLEALQKRVQELEKTQPKPGTGPVASALKTPRGEPTSKLQVGGFAQFRLTNQASSAGDRNLNGNTSFEINRARPRLIYNFDKYWEVDLQLNLFTRSAGAKTSLDSRDMFVEYHNAGYRARFGQQKIPFGYQTYLEGDEDRIAFDRARIFAVNLPDERDQGVVVSTNPSNPRAVKFAAGILNGNGINRDDNNRDKDIAGTVKVPLGAHNTIGASLYNGSFTPTTGGFSNLKQLAGVEHQGYYGRFTTQLEYAWGKALGHEVNGGYAYVQYYLGNVGNIFLRHDIYDPAADSLTPDYWKRTSVGWSKDFNKNVRLTAEYDFITNSATHQKEDDTLGFQVSTRF